MIQHKYISVRIGEPELRERNQELSLLLEMSNLLASSMDLREVFTGALAKVIEHFGLDAGRIYLMDDSRQFLELIVHQGLEPKGLERVHISEGFSGKAVRTKSFIAQRVSELKDKRRSALLLEKGFQVIICVPLLMTDRVEGVMNLASQKMIRLGQPKIDLLTTVGNQMAVAAKDARIYEELQSKIQALQDKEKTIRFFAYSISHDLKSPATSIYALTRRLKERYELLMDEKGKAHCEQIMKTAYDMIYLVEKLNGYVMSKESPLHFERLNVNEVLDAVWVEFSSEFHRRKLKWSVPKQLLEVVGDRLCLLRIFRNLVDNALKYGGDNLTKISVQHRETEDLHIFSVNDDGLGIREEEQAGMFDVFRRNKPSLGISGSGLGLAIVKEAIARHGGSAWVESGPGRGTAIFISLRKDLQPSG